MNTPFIRRVAIRNYGSIAACQLDLEPLTFLVGPNGAGKSNFLDALYERKKGATAAMAYTGLVQSWLEITRLAADNRCTVAPGTGDLFDEAV